MKSFVTKGTVMPRSMAGLPLWTAKFVLLTNIGLALIAQPELHRLWSFVVPEARSLMFTVLL